MAGAFVAGGRGLRVNVKPLAKNEYTNILGFATTTQYSESKKGDKITLFFPPKLVMLTIYNFKRHTRQVYLFDMVLQNVISSNDKIGLYPPTALT